VSTTENGPTIGASETPLPPGEREGTAAKQWEGEGTHQRFTVDSTAYLRNLNREDLWGRTIAIHHQAAPVKTDTGTSMSMRFPLLIVSLYVEEQQAVAEKVARILEKHWDDEA
jgi:hypothetical protein